MHAELHARIVEDGKGATLKVTLKAQLTTLSDMEMAALFYRASIVALEPPRITKDGYLEVVATRDMEKRRTE